MTQEIHRELGAHDARLDALEKDIIAINVNMLRIFEKLDTINNTLSEAKGGWRTLMWVGGCSGVIGAAISHTVSLFTLPGPR
ncbi:MAG: hypothetical protein ABFE02_08930 [Sulfuricella sp.]